MAVDHIQRPGRVKSLRGARMKLVVQGSGDTTEKEKGVRRPHGRAGTDLVAEKRGLSEFL